MKAIIIKARNGSNLRVGDPIEVTPEEFAPLYTEGYAVTATEYEATNNIVKGREASIDAEIEAAIKREAILPKDEASKTAIRANTLIMEGVKPGLGVEFIRAMKGKADSELEQRHTSRVTDEEIITGSVKFGSGDLRSAGSGYLKLQNDQKAILKAGGPGMLKEALRMSSEASAIVKREIFPAILKGGGDFFERDIIRAADNVDPNVGTLATGIVLMRNLGFLKNKLSFMDKISTDLRNEPVAFGQNVISRYITPPTVTTFVPGVGMTTDAAAIAAWRATITASNPAGTPVTGTQTRSVVSTTDTPVVINNYKGVSITFNNLTLGGTMRNLFAEQQGAAFYSLAEQVNLDFLSVLYATTWTPKTGNAGFSLCQGADPVGTPATNPMGLPVIIALKNQFSLNKMPDIGRWVLLHSIYHDAILVDANLLNAKAILALIKKDAGSFEDGELPTLFGIKVLESQLAAGSLAGNAIGGAWANNQLTSATGITAAIGTNGVVGFAGNSASALFAARIPQDYTKVLPEIPATASLEIVTEPDSGLSILLTKRVDHNLQATYMDTGLMYGFAAGDKRQGFNLNA